MPTIDILPGPVGKVKLPIHSIKAGCSKCLKSNGVKTEDCNCSGFKSILHKSVYYPDENFRNILIKMSLFCSETDIASFVFTLDDLSEMF